jgi:transcriptional regulator with XRE-family HTH domain
MPRLLGEKLRYLRTQQQMTQVELTQQLGLARQGYVSNLEAGRKAPSLDLVVQIADLFGVTTDYLLLDTIAVEMVDTHRRSGEDPPAH